MHIGSQITDLAPFADAASRLTGLARELLADGHALQHIDFGGGLGIPYRDDNAPRRTRRRWRRPCARRSRRSVCARSSRSAG